jgi:hypothetical protein
MEAAALALGALLAAACVVFVARPYLRRPEMAAEEDRLAEPDELERRRLELEEERDRTLAALKELEFDHRTGKISTPDYEAQVGPLRRQAAELLRGLDAPEGVRESAVPVEPVPEPSPEPHVPPAPAPAPVPSPEPHVPPVPAPVPEPTPEPHVPPVPRGR